MHPSPLPRVDPAPDQAEVVLIADDAARPRPPRPVARWLVKIQHERHGVPQPAHHAAHDQGGELDSDPLARPRAGGDVESRDMDEGVQGVDEEDECSTPLQRRPAHRLGRRSSEFCPVAAEADILPPPLPHPLQQQHADYEPAITDARSSSSCRYSYGDFSSASSTASSSTSHSGFSSHSASSFTSASSTQTFSAAASGWPVAASTSSASTSPSRQGKTPQVATLPLQSLAAAVERAEGHEAASDGGTPVPEAQVEVLDLPLPSGAACGAVGPSSPATAAREDKPLPPCPKAAEPPSLCAPPTLRHVEPHPAPTGDAHPALPDLPAAAFARPPAPSTASSAIGADDVPVTTTAPHANPHELASDADSLRPPENFAMVSPKLYRSSFPRDKHFPFLRSLGLKSVMVLVQEPYPEENVEFLKAEGIQLFQFGIPGNKEPFVSIPEDKIVGALSTILDARNHPMLIHCNKGKHRTGCVVGCLRRIQMWSLVSVFDEYRRYSHPKSRAMDLQCIEAFGGLSKVWDTVDREHLPQWATLDPPPRPPPALAVASDDDDTASTSSIDGP
ncbi:uncharacterized protein RHOBADRAFT_51769 [Rhodotorula graminis WP1]|uniref:diphosphoinositol-polyphosphate diphosphatase n=1 Tax=Rhodotorula graminis (strain WP1) TaxID=578459 RepID=A0A194S8H3_RHOGW|nr:uncharacterized protein RHOBADRAFT_51769 [Rhodotorula graminis WP1]KPV76775.1 hypothetical protein RHOBADRAFT_51769 [Rhodotorula graminis WP1]